MTFDVTKHYCTDSSGSPLSVDSYVRDGLGNLVEAHESLLMRTIWLVLARSSLSSRLL